MKARMFVLASLVDHRRRTEVLIINTRELFCRSAAVLGRPRRIQALAIQRLAHLPQYRVTAGFYSTGAAEDGRAPTEELSCVNDEYFCSQKIAESHFGEMYRRT